MHMWPSLANTINTDVVSLSTRSGTQLVCCSLVRQEKTCSFFKNLYLCGWSRVDFLGGHLTSEAASNDVPGRSLFQNITSSPWSFFCVSCENAVDVLPQKIRLNQTPVEFLFFWSSCLVGLRLQSVFYLNCLHQSAVLRSLCIWTWSSSDGRR